MALHDQLRTLIDTHGSAILDVAEDFRAALDDFLTEHEATTGEINLLVDAVRLGSVRRLVELIDQGATPEAALADAGSQLARDRDTDPKRAQWALRTLGYALRKVDATIPSVVSPADAGGSPVEGETVAVTPVAGPAPAAGVSTGSTTGRRWRPVVAAVVAALVVVAVGAIVLLSGDDDGGGGGAEPPAAQGNDGGDCTAPVVPLVDDDATEAAQCLAGQLDTWVAAGQMAVGQQVNLADDAWTGPLTALAPNDVRVIGFDFRELASAAADGKDRVPDLTTLGEQGHLLVGSWHADNPWTGTADPGDLTDSDRFTELLGPDGSSAARDRFWAGWDAAIVVMKRLQDADLALIVRPLHEGNGNWFWWGHHPPADYQQVYAAMQERAANAGVHNVLWGFSAANRTYDGIQEPTELLPDVDIAGIDTYDCEQPGTRDERLECGGGGGYVPDQVDLTSYASLQEAAPRMALSEVGPQFSYDGSWSPATITTSVVQNGLSPVYALLWFDDQRQGRPPMSKQIASLQGGTEWLASCPDALCDVSRS